MPTLDDLPTPCLLLDRDQLTRNLARMQAVADRLRVALRPHLKTAKSAEVAKLSVAAGAKGLVIAGVGNGNMTEPALKALAAQSKKGIVCVRSSRVATGQVGRNVEVKDDSLGFVASLGLNPQKSRVLLRLALSQTKDLKTIQRYFDEY